MKMNASLRVVLLKWLFWIGLAWSGSGCTILRDRAPEHVYWQNVHEPGQVMDAYVDALMQGDLARAAAYLYLPVGMEDGPALREQLGRISEAMRQAKAPIRVADSRCETRIALVIYTTNAIGGNPSPVFLIKDSHDLWRLHHKATAGPLQKALRDRIDMLEARALANWGARRMAEINQSARARLLAGVP